MITETMPTAETVDRLPPNSPEAEMGVLGCVLASESPHSSIPQAECMAQCIDRIQSSTAFYDLRNQTIYDSMVEMYDARSPIDEITLYQRLKDRGLIEEVGGLPYITTLADACPSAANLPFYLDILSEKAMLRTLLQTCTETAASVFDFDGKHPRELVEGHERAVLQLLTEKRETQIPIKEAVKQAIDAIAAQHEKQGTGGLMTGLVDLDAKTLGLLPAEVTIIAARPSCGKTSLAMQIAEYNSVDCNLPVGVFSLEMSTQALVIRLLCARGRVDSHNIKRGYLTGRDFQTLGAASLKLSKAPLYIDDTAGLNLLQLRTKARRMHQLYGIKLVVVDYLGLMSGEQKRRENRQQEVADAVKGLKNLAKDLNIHVIVLAQLNRESVKTGGRKSKPRAPRLDDLRESGEIEQSADLAFLMHAEDEFGRDIVLDVAKQRNGRTGPVNLTFLKEFTRFENAAKKKEDCDD
jgi:replicative DNA helicase